MRKICPKCDGKGYWIKRDYGNLWLAPFTLGISLIGFAEGEEIECGVCDCKGYLLPNQETK